MVKLSVREFEKLCDVLSPREFVFFSENQSWNMMEHTLKVKLTFKIMLIAFNPNTICFKNHTDFLRLDRVKCVKMMSDTSMLGSIFTIICGDSNDNINDVAYTIIAR